MLFGDHIQWLGYLCHFNRCYYSLNSQDRLVWLGRITAVDMVNGMQL